MNSLTVLLTVASTSVTGPINSDEHGTYAIVDVLVAPHGTTERQFGKNVELIENWIAIATDTGEDGSLQPGSVHLCKHDEFGSRSARLLHAPDRTWPDEFGSDMASSNRHLLVGAPGDSESDWDSGAAWLYALQDEWSLVSALQPKVVESGARFGDAVALDGSWAAIGAPRSDGSGIASGAVHVFDGRSGSWQEAQRIEAPDGASGDFFGDSVALSGRWLAIGAWGDDDRGEKSGSVWIYHREREEWRPVQKIVPRELESRDRFGCSVELSGDWLLIGSSGWNTNQGAICTFKLEGAKWRKDRRLHASVGTSEEWLGFSLAVTKDLMVSGVPGRRDGDVMDGGIDVFKLEAGTWRWIQRVTPSRKEWRQPHQFGWSVATDGTRIMVGRSDDADGPAEPGRAWLLEERKEAPAFTAPISGVADPTR